MEKTLVLTFKTEDKKSYRLNIREPKEGVAKDSLTPLVEKILNDNILDNSKRTLASFEKAAYITRTEEEIN